MTEEEIIEYVHGLGNEWDLDIERNLKYKLSSLLSQEREKMHREYEILVNTIIDTHNIEKAEIRESAVMGFISHLQPDIDANEEWYPVTREWFLEKMESYFSHQKNEEKI